MDTRIRDKNGADEHAVCLLNADRRSISLRDAKLVTTSEDKNTRLSRLLRSQRRWRQLVRNSATELVLFCSAILVSVIRLRATLSISQSPSRVAKQTCVAFVRTGASSGPPSPEQLSSPVCETAAVLAHSIRHDGWLPDPPVRRCLVFSWWRASEEVSKRSRQFATRLLVCVESPSAQVGQRLHTDRQTDRQTALMKDGSNESQSSGPAGMCEGAMTPMKRPGTLQRACAVGMLVLERTL